MGGDTVAWRPDAATLERANLAHFMRAAGIASYDELLARADAEPAWFYEALLKHLDYRFYKPYTQVLDESRGAPWTRWCVGGTTNVVLNALDRWRGTPTWDKPALEWEGEDRRHASYTWVSVALRLPSLFSVTPSPSTSSASRAASPQVSARSTEAIR